LGYLISFQGLQWTDHNNDFFLPSENSQSFED
jgi:hypothetical protein